MDGTAQSTEQVPLRRLIDVAYEDFTYGLLSTNARYLVWGAISSAGELTRNYLTSNGRADLADQRRTARSLSEADNKHLSVVSDAAEEAVRYLTWARGRENGQPILRDALVAYCVSFENCLKNVALAFGLSASQRSGLDQLVFLPGPEFRAALRSVRQAWDSAGGRGVFRAQQFFDLYIVEKNPEPRRYAFQTAAGESWAVCECAFTIRNAIIHQLSRPFEQVSIGESTFSAMAPIELRPLDLLKISRAMQDIMFPLDSLSLSISSTFQ